MANVVNRIYLFILRLLDEETGGELLLRLAAGDLAPHWQNPTLPAKESGGAKGLQEPSRQAVCNAPKGESERLPIHLSAKSRFSTIDHCLYFASTYGGDAHGPGK